MAKSVEKQQTDLSAKSQSRSASHSSAQMSSPDSASDKTPYNEKTQRIMAWSNLLRSLQPFIWGVIILVVVVPLIGKAILLRSSSLTPAQTSTQPRTEITVPVIPTGDNIDQALIDAVFTAHESAQEFAKTELDDWEIQLEDRVENFLDWYTGLYTGKGSDTPFTVTGSITMKFIWKATP